MLRATPSDRATERTPTITNPTRFCQFGTRLMAVNKQQGLWWHTAGSFDAFTSLTAAPKADAPPAPPSPPAGAATDQHRISGDPHIYPDAATVNEMRRVGLIALRASVEVCIATTGEVTSVSISRSSGYPAYDTKLAHEIARWRYSPRAGNQADPECRVISFKYRLADHEAGGGAAPGHVPPGTSGQP